ncbi:TetR/AcrR family transcriptional regulator [Williamsia maris]|uniref:Transcriptional regulator, TetR family n=1 Tax=Williamsia maris TaxID=72806 RepID=A0ABT1HBF9_9NOCA|nr:TetR/AcrR family transcriptional regulator [Williamsia maris]MCP2175519.1 transcriptional regulator, TetR family [Williamsia maris]
MESDKAVPTGGRRNVKRGQERADRTRDLVIAETISCIREEGFAAASTRRIIERAGLTSGVIQYHFGTRDGLLTAVVDFALARLVSSIGELTTSVEGVDDPDQRLRTLAQTAWSTFNSPASMAALEILIATRSIRDRLDVDNLEVLIPGLARISQLVGDSTHATAIGNLLWAAPVGLMVAELVVQFPPPTQPEQHAFAQLLIDHRHRGLPS